MSEIKLFMAPGTCARVTSIALEEIGLDFETVLIRFMRGEHKSPEFKKINPKGKVPTLLIDDQALTENVAILSYLNSAFPDAQLLPSTADAMDKARQLADLSFCAATLHPLVTRIRMPHFFADKEAAKSVWQMGCEAMNEYFQLIDSRLDGQPWWYGDQWSVMDAYLYWIYWRCEGAGYPADGYPHYQAHAAGMEARDSTQKALAREAEAQKQLESEGLVFTPPPLDDTD